MWQLEKKHLSPQQAGFMKHRYIENQIAWATAAKSN